jgi:hypothetical protein
VVRRRPPGWLFAHGGSRSTPFSRDLISRKRRLPFSSEGDRPGLLRKFQAAYCAMPLPNDQFSFFTSTRVMNTSSGRTASAAASPWAIDL